MLTARPGLAVGLAVLAVGLESQAYVWTVLPELMKYEFEKGPEIFTSGNDSE